jgi:hypothetical protein
MRMTNGTKRHRGRGLNGRQCAYVLNLCEGMTRRGAALAAGYGKGSEAAGGQLRAIPS